jgi:hypothetical protein
MACRAADTLNPTEEVDIASDYREIKPPAGPDIAVADFAGIMAQIPVKSASKIS